MAISGSKPHSSLGFRVYKKCKSHKEVIEEVKKLHNDFKRTYVRRIGRLGDLYPYEIWII